MAEGEEGSRRGELVVTFGGGLFPCFPFALDVFLLGNIPHFLTEGALKADTITKGLGVRRWVEQSQNTSPTTHTHTRTHTCMQGSLTHRHKVEESACLC